jgi:hypothetical protein
VAIAQFYIANGVRRAVAARECGLQSILALWKQAGQPDQLIDVLLAQLHSPKDVVDGSHPRYLRIVQGMSSRASRARIPPIEIELLGSPGQSGSVPLEKVKLQ